MGRRSTSEQLRAEGCNKIYREKVSGARPDRRELLKLLKALAPGDVMTVTRIASSTKNWFCPTRRKRRPANSND
jgi:hypothetical protein